MKTSKDVSLRIQNLEHRLQKDKMDVSEQITTLKRLSLCSEEELQKRLEVCAKNKFYSEIREILWFLE